VVAANARQGFHTTTVRRWWSLVRPGTFASAGLAGSSAGSFGLPQPVLGGVPTGHARRVRPLQPRSAVAVAKASPQKNCYVERFNGSMRDELLDGELFHSVLEAKVVIGRWIADYNYRRPHRGLGMATPAAYDQAERARLKSESEGSGYEDPPPSPMDQFLGPRDVMAGAATNGRSLWLGSLHAGNDYGIDKVDLQHATVSSVSGLTRNATGDQVLTH
jgi:Integrase core domain